MAPLTLYDAARCPYCARVRIVLAEKDIEYETVEIDLSDRPAWLYEKNPTGRVPVIEEDGWRPLPESAVIMEFLEERYPEPALLPPIPPTARCARLRIFRDGRADRRRTTRSGAARTERASGSTRQLGRLDALLGERP